MRYARQLLRAAQDVSIPTGNAIPAPKYWEPASKAPSPVLHMVIGCGVGLVFAGYYKVRYFYLRKKLTLGGPVVKGSYIAHTPYQEYT